MGREHGQKMLYCDPKAIFLRLTSRTCGICTKEKCDDFDDDSFSRLASSECIATRVWKIGEDIAGASANSELEVFVGLGADWGLMGESTESGDAKANGGRKFW